MVWKLFALCSLACADAQLSDLIPVAFLDLSLIRPHMLAGNIRQKIYQLLKPEPFAAVFRCYIADRGLKHLIPFITIVLLHGIHDERLQPLGVIAARFEHVAQSLHHQLQLVIDFRVVPESVCHAEAQ